MRVLQSQTSLWPQESAEVRPATSLVSEVGPLGDSASQLRGSRERWSPWPEVTEQGRGPSRQLHRPRLCLRMEAVRGSTGPAERPLLPLVSESSGTASRESRAFEVSWIPGAFGGRSGHIVLLAAPSLQVTSATGTALFSHLDLRVHRL